MEKKSEQVIKLSQLYLRHQYYGKLEKSSCNGYTCMCFALGGSCEHKHHFPSTSTKAIILSSHIILGKAIYNTANYLLLCNNIDTSKKIVYNVKLIL